MELWAGPECTVNRTGDRFRDQTRLSGHHHRIEDLARIAALGVRVLRYPVLWERVAPDRPDEQDWRWSDERLAEIARLGMEPIVGLLHHGSGPRYTSLVSDNFVRLLADHAAAAARRYPHVTRWTPVNEPLTTARFSTLYGVWYPHARDERSFWSALLNQVDGTRAAMRAIRREVPDTQLIQTEDLGEVHATPALQGHADYLNQRRWLSWDLLAGRVTRDHFFWAEASALGFGDRLRAIADDPFPPDMLGVNYYPTSERFLDDRGADLPALGYHDRTALRALDPPPAGFAGVLRQAWDRYGLPMAVTECHLGCTREEQLRWLWQAWRQCRDLADDGVDLRALTVWALFGSTDWNSLLTQAAGHYEPGAFDIRGAAPRPTALADLVRLLGRGGDTIEPHHPLHPVVVGQGWWQRDLRLEQPIFTRPAATVAQLEPEPARPILITGAAGTLAQAFAGACRLRGLPHLLTDHASLPIDRADLVNRALDLYRPWAVINAAGWACPDSAEDAPDACRRTETEGAALLAAACAKRGIHCTLFSCDQVFDGGVDAPYREGAVTRPGNVLGRAKADGEAHALAAAPGTLIVRTAALFSPYDENNVAAAVARALAAGDRFAASPDHVSSPTYAPDLVSLCLDLAIDRADGVWHLAGEEAMSGLDFARRIAAALGLDPERVVPADPAALGWRARRPRYAALTSTRGAMLPPFADALARHVAVRGPIVQTALS